ncbi:hypothetical protein LTR95_000794 [Oleoguttula sp. CCFEE 5521]
MGYIVVGTQSTDHSIEDALVKSGGTKRALEPPWNSGPSYSEVEDQKVLVVRSGLSPQLKHVQTATLFETPNVDDLEIPPWLAARVGGDEELKGPIHNYARLFTWWQLAHTVEQALSRTLDNISGNKACRNSEDPARIPTGKLQLNDLKADSKGTALYCKVGVQGIKAYREWADMTSALYLYMFIAACVAVFVQWGTTGASVLIAYKTPTVGLGCRSGSYLVYGATGTVAWLCLLIGACFSHEAMLRYQTAHVRDRALVFRRDSTRHSQPANGSTQGGTPQQPPHPQGTVQPGLYERNFSHRAICGLAVSFRLFGKLLCFLNTWLLILTSLAEFMGGFDNCWCQGNYPGMGNNGWVVLFKNSSDLENSALAPWAGGLSMTVVVCSVTLAWFWLASKTR